MRIEVFPDVTYGILAVFYLYHVSCISGEKLDLLQVKQGENVTEGMVMSQSSYSLLSFRNLLSLADESHRTGLTLIF